MGFVVINDRSRSTPHLKLMRSRITGKLQLYEDSVFKSQSCDRYEQWDMDFVRAEMQKECDLRGIDTIVEDCVHYRTPEADYLQTHQWIPVDVTAGGEVRLDPGLLTMLAGVIIKWVIPTICLAFIVGWVGIWFVGPLTRPPKAYKGFYQSDREGNTVGPMTYTEFYTWKQAEFPDKYPCHYCGQLFDTEEERDAHEKVCPWKDKAWTQEIWEPQIPFLNALMVAGIAIVGLFVGGQIISAYIGRKGG